jgi:hypothetical protein
MSSKTRRSASDVIGIYDTARAQSIQLSDKPLFFLSLPFFVRMFCFSCDSCMTFDCSSFKKRHQCNAWQAIFKTFSASDWMAALFYVGSKLFAKGLKSCPFLVPPSLSLSLSLSFSLSCSGFLLLNHKELLVSLLLSQRHRTKMISVSVKPFVMTGFESNETLNTGGFEDIRQTGFQHLNHFDMLKI